MQLQWYKNRRVPFIRYACIIRCVSDPEMFQRGGGGEERGWGEHFGKFAGLFTLWTSKTYAWSVFKHLFEK